MDPSLSILLFSITGSNTGPYQTRRLTARIQAKVISQIKGRFGTGIRWFPHDDPRPIKNVHSCTPHPLARVTVIAGPYDRPNVGLPDPCTVFEPGTSGSTR